MLGSSMKEKTFEKTFVSHSNPREHMVLNQFVLGNFVVGIVKKPYHLLLKLQYMKQGLGDFMP